MGSDDVRRVAMRVRQIGDDVRQLVDRALTGHSDQRMPTATAAFRQRMAEEAIRVHGVAARLDDAVDALVHHAAAIDTGSAKTVFGGG